MALVVLSLGIMTCVWRSDAAGSVDAMSLCLLATMSNSAMSCFAGKVMSEAVDALQLIFLTAPISLLFMLPYPLYKEVRDLHNLHIRFSIKSKYYWLLGAYGESLFLPPLLLLECGW